MSRSLEAEPYISVVVFKMFLFWEKTESERVDILLLSWVGITFKYFLLALVYISVDFSDALYSLPYFSVDFFSY
jgi:hypothetical protein